MTLFCSPFSYFEKNLSKIAQLFIAKQNGDVSIGSIHPWNSYLRQTIAELYYNQFLKDNL